MLRTSTEKLRKNHKGHNLKNVRTFLGVKQEALAMGLGISQQEISEIEGQEEIEEELLSQIATALEVSPEVIKGFDMDKTIYNINNYKDTTICEGGTAIGLQINPIDKIVELYERLLKSEREKVELLKNR